MCSFTPNAALFAKKHVQSITPSDLDPSEGTIFEFEPHSQYIRPDAEPLGFFSPSERWTASPWAPEGDNAAIFYNTIPLSLSLPSLRCYTVAQSFDGVEEPGRLPRTDSFARTHSSCGLSQTSTSDFHRDSFQAMMSDTSEVAFIPSGECTEPLPNFSSSSPSSPLLQRSGGRPQGQYVLRPEGCCEHVEQWTRKRTKRLFEFLECKECGAKWCAPREPLMRKETAPTVHNSGLHIKEKAGVNVVLNYPGPIFLKSFELLFQLSDPLES